MHNDLNRTKEMEQCGESELEKDEDETVAEIYIDKITLLRRDHRLFFDTLPTEFWKWCLNYCFATCIASAGLTDVSSLHKVMRINKAFKSLQDRIMGSTSAECASKKREKAYFNPLL